LNANSVAQSTELWHDTCYMRVLRSPAAVGLVVFVLVLAALPASFAARALLIVPLVLVPYRVAAGRSALAWIALGTALPLAAAFGLERGATAAVLAMPWLASCLLLAADAIADGIRSLPAILLPSRAGQLLARAAGIFLAVGAVFAVLDRAGLGVLGLDQDVVLVTAVHFHVLGFGLIAAASGLAGGSRWAAASAFPFLFGIPLTAAGFTFGSTLLQWLGAVFVVGGALLVAAALAGFGARHRGWRPTAASLAGVALVIGAPMGLWWASAIQFGAPFVDFGTMAATHGALNTVAVALATFAVPGWRR
jgi:hypothetical protein